MKERTLKTQLYSFTENKPWLQEVTISKPSRVVLTSREKELTI